MTKAIKAFLAASFLATGISAAAADALKIGVAAPVTGAFQALGHQLVDGARVAISKASGALQADMVTADDQCTPEGGTAAANALVAQKVDIVVGFLCSDALEAAVPILDEKHIPIITPGVRAPTLTEERAATRPPVFRLQPEPDMEAEAAADILGRLWRDKLFAIVDDGTIYGRDLAETVRLDLEQKGLKSVFDDTYRPGLDNQASLVIRLKRAGATAAFVGGQRDDVAVIGRDAARLDVPLVLAGGEALRAAPGAVDLEPGTLMIGPPLAEDLPSAAAADAAINQAGALAEGYAVPAYAAVEIAEQAAKKAAASGAAPADVLAKTEFSTALGPVRFGQNGSRTGNPYQVYRYDGQHFVKAEN